MFNDRIMMFFGAFALGQAVQLLAHALCMPVKASLQVPACAAAGFLVGVMIGLGVFVAKKEGGRH